MGTVQVGANPRITLARCGLKFAELHQLSCAGHPRGWSLRLTDSQENETCGFFPLNLFFPFGHLKTTLQPAVPVSGRRVVAPECGAEGTHDDLVFAVARACWNAQNAYPNHPAGAEQWWTNQHQADAARIFRKKKE